jgi:hypothetical protein
MIERRSPLRLKLAIDVASERHDELQLRALPDATTLIGVISNQSPKPPQS